MKINNILIKPHITEKSIDRSSQNKSFCFQVNRLANKHQIKNAVESIYKVEVSKISTMIKKGKIKRVGRKMRPKKAPDKKLAYIKLSKGEINLFPKTQ